MKRYLVFFGKYYLPEGGMNDFINSFDTVEEAEKCMIESFIKEVQYTNYTLDEFAKWKVDYYFCHIHDLDTNEIIFENSKRVADKISKMILSHGK